VSQFKIYSSSAGSGKTYTLTKEYLKIALSNESPYYFRHILAITFTNDSANEMKHRIIQNLKNFAYPQWLTENEKKKSNFLLENIANEIGENPEKIRQRAKQVFTKILHNYADFAVSTIDKFVNRVVSAFTRELEIPYNYEVDMDTEQLLGNAIERVLEKVGREEKDELSVLIMDWVKIKMEENQNWLTTGNELAHFAKNLMQENAYPFLNELKDFKMQDFKAIHYFIRNEIKNIEQKIVQNAQDILNLFKRFNITTNDITGKSTGILGFLNNLLNSTKTEEIIKKLPDENGIKTVRDILNKNKPWFSAKKIPADWQNIIPELNLLLEEIFALGTQIEQYPLYKLIEPHIFKIALIQEIELEIAEVKRENNAIHISDTTKKISEIISTEPVPYIYERVGEKYHHILIDEFQDTSNLQWQNLLPLVENGLSEGNFNLIVGDGKQAIYRWRGGELEQLIFLYNQEWEKLQQNIKNEEELELLMQRYDTLAQYHSTENLNFNYRSRQEIINFNNDFFEFIKNSDFGLIYPMIPQVYDESFAQKSPQNAPQGGNVEIFFLPKKDKKNKKNADNTAQNANFLADIHSEIDLNIDLMDLKNENSEEKTEKEDNDENDQKNAYDSSNNSSNDDDNYEIPNLNQEKTLEIILKCQQEGWLLGDIAVLIRDNKQGNAIANYLKQESINVTSQNSLLLKSDNKILFIIALLKVFHQPDNKLAKSDALYLYHKIIKKQAPNIQDNLEIKEILDKSIVKFYEKFQNEGYSLNLARLSALNLYELIEKLMGIFDLFNTQPKTEYLLRLLDVVLEFSLQKQATIADFLEFWEKKKKDLSINAPADRNAVIITTIHKAKGLEYPIVIMPFTDWGYLPNYKNTVWVHFEGEGLSPNPHKTPPLRVGLVNLKKELQHTSLAPQYMAEKEKLFLESLNILYVAFTRPVHKLYILATLEDFPNFLNPKKGKKIEDMPSVNYWLYLYLLHNNLWDNNTLHYILKSGEIIPEKNPNDDENTFWVDELVVTDTHKTLKLNRKPDYSRIGHILGVHD
jgi:ATP-dependent helicase/nuclease subunit A